MRPETTWHCTVEHLNLVGQSQMGFQLMRLFTKWKEQHRGEPVLLLVEYPGEPAGGFCVTPRRAPWLLRVIWRLFPPI